MQFDNMLKNSLIAVIVVARHYEPELLHFLSNAHFPAQI